jgi:serine protease Do
MMIFFLDADGKVYSRYGGRDSKDPDNRQSLEGLHYTMESVLRMHEGEEKAFARRIQEGPRYIRQTAGGMRGRCLHCHQVKEILHAELQRKGEWSRDLVWRYPLPDNLGFILDVDRGNVVKEVKSGTPASEVGLAAGDVLQRLGGVPIHSFGDAQFALDIAPKSGTVELVWRRGDKELRQRMPLPEGWRQTDLSWRPSLRWFIPSARLYGQDLTAAEKKAAGLQTKQLAFKQRNEVPSQARAAGVQPGDVIFGVDGKYLEMDAGEFLRYIERSYLVGDRVTVNVLRDGKRLNLTMTLQR